MSDMRFLYQPSMPALAIALLAHRFATHLLHAVGAAAQPLLTPGRGQRRRPPRLAADATVFVIPPSQVKAAQGRTPVRSGPFDPTLVRSSTARSGWKTSARLFHDGLLVFTLVRGRPSPDRTFRRGSEPRRQPVADDQRNDHAHNDEHRFTEHAPVHLRSLAASDGMLQGRPRLITGPTRRLSPGPAPAAVGCTPLRRFRRGRTGSRVPAAV